jgi:hypothetical protein
MRATAEAVSRIHIVLRMRSDHATSGAEFIRRRLDTISQLSVESGETRNHLTRSVCYSRKTIAVAASSDFTPPAEFETARPGFAVARPRAWSVRTGSVS